MVAGESYKIYEGLSVGRGVEVGRGTVSDGRVGSQLLSPVPVLVM